MNNENINEIISKLDRIDYLRHEIPNLLDKFGDLTLQEIHEKDNAKKDAAKSLREFQKDQEKALTEIAPHYPSKDAQATQLEKLFEAYPEMRTYTKKYEFSNYIDFYPIRRPTGDDTVLTSPKYILWAIGLLLIPITLIYWILSLVGIIALPDIFAFAISWALPIAAFLILRKAPLEDMISYGSFYTSVKEYPQKVARFKKSFNIFYSQEEYEKVYRAFAAYEEKVSSFVEICEKKRSEELPKLEKQIEAIDKKYWDITSPILSKKSELEDELNATDLIHKDLYYDIPRISSILKMGRADSLKEAINLALSEKRQEEAAREQREILEQQAYDNMMHNMAMERAAEEQARAMREHNAAMEQAARDQASAAKAQASAMQAQAREAEKQTQMAQRQAKDAQYAASERCRGCANLGRCGSAYGKAAVGCASYRPR